MRVEVFGPTAAFAHESLTVTNAVKTLTAATYNPTTGVTAADAGKACFALITVETDQIRWTYDGTTPSGTAGHLANVNDVITLEGQQHIANFKAYRVTNDATIKVTYER